MKPFLSFILCLTLSTTIFAQTKTISRDTINLTGVVYSSDGKVVPDLEIRSRHADPRFERSRISTKTDANGRFKLDGVMPNDTLMIASVKYDKLQYYNKGSRSMLIFLPQEHITDINSANPIEIKASRLKPKEISEITVTASEGTPTFTVVVRAEFPGGNENFVSFIKKKIEYPTAAIKNSIEGTVEVAFTVEKDGKLDEFIVLKGLGYGCDEEVIKAASKVPHGDRLF